jgi:hypothetical protein
VSRVAKSPVIDADTVEREIIVRLRAANLRLRFDKAALRLVGGLKAALANAVPEGKTLIFTISAPIKLPGKTAEALEKMMRSDPPKAERREIVQGNEVRIRRLRGVPKGMPKALGFVHSVGSDAGAILALVEARLLDPNGGA